jgi:dolichol-phosphate mannosyltransferase
MPSGLRRTVYAVIRIGTSKLAMKFVLVGVACLALAEAILYLLVDVWGVNSLVAGAASIEISVVANFMINDAWTFRENRSSDGFFARMLKFHVTRVASIAVNFGIYSMLVALLGVNHLVAYFVATFVAFSINFLTSVVWVWRGTLDSYTGTPQGKAAFSTSSTSDSLNPRTLRPRSMRAK